MIIFSKERDSYWKMMQKYIGSDVTSMVTLPVLIFEPMTMLQKMAEVCASLCICHYPNIWPFGSPLLVLTMQYL